MDIKLDIYKDRFCRNLDRTVTAPDFSLSLQICEDVLAAANIDIFEGLDGASDQSKSEVLFTVVKNGLPIFKDLLKELFELDDKEIGKTKLEDIAKAIMDIVKYSMNQLKVSFKGKN